MNDTMKTILGLVIVALLIATPICIIGYTVSNQEIQTWQYQDLERTTKTYPELVPIVNKKMEDNKISNCEYTEILGEQEKTIKERFKKSLEQ